MKTSEFYAAFRAVPESVYPQETAAESPFPSHLNARLEEAAEKRLFCALRACLRQQGIVIFQALTALFRFAHPWLKAMGYQVGRIYT